MEVISTSISEAARALSIGRTTIYKLIREGRLEIVKIGRRTLVKANSIRKLVEDKTNQDI
jgi:excisionase family DNA binding protein